MKIKRFFCLLLLGALLTGCAVRPAAETKPTGLPETVPQTVSAPMETTETEEDLLVPTEVVTEPVPTDPPETEPPVPETEPTPTLVENTAFTALAGDDCDPSILGVLYNAPFVDGEPKPTQVWCEGEYDQLVIFPRWVGSEVSAWQVLHYQDEETEYERLNGPIYSAVCQDGDSFAAALDRPEGQSAWTVSVTAPDGSEAQLELFYNGRYGTYAYEYLVDHSAWLSDEKQALDSGIVNYLVELVGKEAFCSLLRASDRMGRDPWAVMERYCSPLAEVGDTAAYTVCQGEMEGGCYVLEAARLHENYDPFQGSVAERAAYQAAMYKEIGNARGILGPDRDGGEALYFELNGLTVYNPTLLAREITVSVNGIETGTYDLTEGDFVTLVDVCCGELPADAPVRIEVRVTQSRGAADAAILEIWPGLGGNISGAR